MNFDIHAGQIQGRRDFQEDEPGVVDTGFGLLAAVADGVGGQPWGAVASKLAVTACLQQAIEMCDSNEIMPNKLLAGAFSRAHNQIKDVCGNAPRYRKMATTLAAIYIRDQVLYRGWVGDSLIFRLRGGTLEILGAHPDMNNTWTDALMFGQRLLIDGLDEGQQVLSGDRILLATDGILTLERELVRDCLKSAQLPSEAAHALLNQINERDEPTQDNCTVVCLFAS